MAFHTKRTKHSGVTEQARLRVDLLGDAVVDADRGQILGDEPLLAVALDDAALKREVIHGGFEALFTPKPPSEI